MTSDASELCLQGRNFFHELMNRAGDPRRDEGYLIEPVGHLVQASTRYASLLVEAAHAQCTTGQGNISQERFDRMNAVIRQCLDELCDTLPTGEKARVQPYFGIDPAEVAKCVAIEAYRRSRS